MSILPYPAAISKWEYHRQKTSIIVKKLRKASQKYTFPEWRVIRMADCSKIISYVYCPACGSMHIAKAWLCRDRLCPTCAWRLSLKRIWEMTQTLNYLSIWQDSACKVAMLTLTMKNVKLADIDKAITEMLDAWKLMTKRRPFKAAVKGFCRSVELTKGTNGTWHPHIHALLWFDVSYQCDIKQKEWAEMWRQSLKVDYIPIVDIRAAYSKNNNVSDTWDKLLSATVEATKYVMKNDILLQCSPKQLVELAAALKNKLLVSYGGIIRDARRALKLKDKDQPDEISERTLECPKCSAEMLEVTFAWAESANVYELNPIRFHKAAD